MKQNLSIRVRLKQQSRTLYMFALLIFLHSPAKAYTGNQFLQLNDLEQVGRLAQTSYVAGIVDTLSLFKMFNMPTACIPPGVTNNQLVDILIKALREKPESREMPANLALIDRMITLWPCEKERKRN